MACASYQSVPRASSTSPGRADGRSKKRLMARCFHLRRPACRTRQAVCASRVAGRAVFCVASQIETAHLPPCRTTEGLARTKCGTPLQSVKRVPKLFWHHAQSRLLPVAIVLLTRTFFVTKSPRSPCIGPFPTPSALLKIIDSIYGDVPLSKVKINARQEYEYLTNYKVLQKAFKDHQIDKVRRRARQYARF